MHRIPVTLVTSVEVLLLSTIPAGHVRVPVQANTYRPTGIKRVPGLTLSFSDGRLPSTALENRA